MSVIPQIRYKIEELEKVLDSPPVKEGQELYQGKDYDISFDHVSFRYDEKEVLHDISLKIKENADFSVVSIFPYHCRRIWTCTGCNDDA